MTDDSEKFVKDVRRILDEENHNLDSHTLSALSRARKKALSEKSRKLPWFWGWSLVPATGAILMVLLLRQPTDLIQPGIDEITDLQILTSDESLEFFQEDMAFYEWIEEVMDNESVHLDDSTTDNDINNDLVSTDIFERKPEQFTARRAESGWRTTGVSWFI